MIHYLIGDATDPQGGGVKVIPHICNDIGGWGRGFVLALSAKWPQPEAAYREWHRTNQPIPFELGRAMSVQVEPDIFVTNIIGQHKIKPTDGVPPIRYEAVRAGLLHVVKFFKDQGATVHMPRIGCGLAGGTWDQIEPIIQEILVANGLEVFVYDLPEAA